MGRNGVLHGSGRRGVTCALLVLLWVAGNARAQTRGQAARPRIGLALSGGSARGFAHIGVLQWLEEHRVPVDYVAGTSMGGLVGGLYASGYTAAEMDEFVREVRWDEVLWPEAPYAKMSFRRKEDRREYPSQLDLGLRDGLNLPSGLSPGHGVGLVLSRFAAPYAGLESFDELPTPFRCVATDLIEGKQVVLKQGDLSEALRATMSIPGLFSPVRVGNQVLVDGGTLNNLPVDVVKDMGADIVIAVALLEAPGESGEPRSLIAVAQRSLDVMITAGELESLQLADLVLLPDLRGLRSSDFDRYEEFRRRGYEAAEKKRSLLETFAVSEEEWRAYLEARDRRRRPQSITPQFVEISGALPEHKARMERELKAHVGRELEREELEADLTRLAGLGRYQSADYRYRKQGDASGLEIHVEEKRHAPPTLNTTLAIDGTEVDNVRFGIGARLTFLDFGGPFSEWRTDFLLGSTNRVASEYYWRIGGSRVFLAPRGFWEQSQPGLYVNNERIADYDRRDLGAGIDLGLAASPAHEIRLGYQLSHTRTKVEIGFPVLPSVEGNTSSVQAQWRYDGMDDYLIPRHGLRIRTRAEWVFSAPGVADPYPVLEANFTVAAPVGARHIVLSTLAGGSTLGRTVVIQPFTLGGPLRLSALASDQLRGENYYLANSFLLRSLLDRPWSFFRRTYVGVGYEVGRAFREGGDTARPFHNGTLGLVTDTYLGAIFVGSSVGDKGAQRFFLRLGRLF